MTVQIGDIYQYQSKDYTVAALSSAIPFDPRDFGFEPSSVCTACWAGFWCDYAIIDDELQLKNLYIHVDNDKYPLFNGVEVSPPEFEELEYYTRKKEKRETFTIPAYHGHRVYRDVGLPIPYTGKILAGAGLIEDDCMQWGYPKIWEFEEPIEFIFEEGILLDCSDLSLIMKALREAMKRREEDTRHPGRKLIKYIEDNSLADDMEKAWWWKLYML